MALDIKEYRFGSQTTGSPNMATVYTSFPIQGHLLKVMVDSAGGLTNGSLFLAVSGTNEEVHRINNVANGKTTAYPRVVPVDNTNASLSGNAPSVVERVSNAPLFLQASGVSLSSTGSGINDVIVWYY